MTIWFAQNSTVNIDSVNQWNDVADGSGNWLTWASLDAADILVANAKTAITINVSFTCLRITTSNADGGTAGGGFVVASPGLTIVANLSVVGFIITANGTTTIVGDQLLPPQGGNCVTVNNGGHLILLGNVNGGRGANSQSAGIDLTNGSSVSITGEVRGGLDSVGGGIGGTRAGVRNASYGAITVSGEVYGSTISSQAGIVLTLTSTGAVIVHGDVYAANGFLSAGIQTQSTGTIAVYGDVYAGMVQGIAGIGTPGVISVEGELIGTVSAAAVNTTGTLRLTSSGINTAINGMLSVANTRVLISPTEELQMNLATFDGVITGPIRSFYTGGTNLGQPVIADVRFGTAFGASSEYEGTLIVPNPAFVSLGVETDNTVGSLTAGLDESALHTALDTYTNKDNWKATGFPDVAAFEARTLPSADYVTSEQLANLESARLPRLS